MYKHLNIHYSFMLYIQN